MDVNTELRIIEDEQVNREKESLEKSSLLGTHTAVMVTAEISVRRSAPDREIEREESGHSEFGTSPLGRFQSLHSSQSGERDKMISYVPPLEEVKVLQFEGYIVGRGS